MQKPKISAGNRIIEDQRRASREITEGIEDQIRALHIINVAKRIKELIFFSLIYITGALIVCFLNEYTPLLILGILFMGITFNSLGILIHEGLHGLLAKNSKVNHLLSFLVGLPLMVSATGYQVTHTDHHYELGRKKDYGTYKQHTKNPIFVWLAYFAQLLFGSFLYIGLIPFLSFRVASSRSKFFIILEYTVMISTYAAFFYYAPVNVILLYWFYPVLFSSILTNIRGIASHALGDVENIYLSSRTIKSSKFVAFIFLYENYHLEHHLFPSVPSYNLSKLHSLIWNRLPQAVYSESYIKFLLTFFKAALSNDLSPAGVIKPSDIN